MNVENLFIIVMIEIVELTHMNQNVIMNKYIKTDIEQGLKYLKTGIMNSLAAIENGEKELILGDYVPFSLVIKCAEKRGWIESEHCSFDIGNDTDCWYYMKLPNSELEVCISSCLWKGQETKLNIVQL